MKNKYTNADRLILIVTAVLLAFVYESASRSVYNEGAGMWHGLNFNLAVYVGSLAGAFLLFLVSSFVLDRIRSAHGSGELPQAGRIILNVIYTAAAAAVFVLIYEIYIHECDLYPGTSASTYLRQEVPHKLYFAFVVLAAAAALLSVSRLTENTAANLKLRFSAAVLMAAVNAAALYAPNMFADRGGGVPHIHAVTNTIINVAKLQPYDAHNVSIYGHYGLICLPFVKLLGSDFYGVMQTLALMGFFTYLAAFYVAHKIIRHNAVFLAAVAGITGTTSVLTRRGQYFQINPLRLLFPMLMLAVLTFGAYHNTKKARRITVILEILTGTASVIWNFEMGLFCVAVCMCVIVFRALSEYPVFSRRTVISVLTAVLYFVLCTGGAYGIVNLYNLACGGSINSPRLFIYPLFSGVYNVNHLRAELPSVVYLYFFQILLFFLTVLALLRKQQLKASVSVPADTVCFAISLSGLSSLIYFMNRAAYGNMAISHIQMCMLLACFGEHALTFTRERVKAALKEPGTWLACIMSAVLFGGSLWMAAEGILYISVCLDYRATSSWLTADMDRGIEEIRAKVPEDTFAFGFCVPEIYYQLGWDNALPMIDWSDINDLNREYAMEEAAKHDRVLISGVDFENKDYKAVQKIEIDPYEFILYEKTDGSQNAKKAAAPKKR